MAHVFGDTDIHNSAGIAVFDGLVYFGEWGGLGGWSGARTAHHRAIFYHLHLHFYMNLMLRSLIFTCIST